MSKFPSDSAITSKAVAACLRERGWIMCSHPWHGQVDNGGGFHVSTESASDGSAHLVVQHHRARAVSGSFDAEPPESEVAVETRAAADAYAEQLAERWHCERAEGQDGAPIVRMLGPLHSLESVRSRFLSPLGRLPDRVAEAVGRMTDVDEAVEMLDARSMVPQGWFDDPRRVHLPPEGGAPTQRPLFVRAAATLAMDVTNVERAEELARQVAVDLAPWGVAPARRVAWRVVPSNRMKVLPHWHREDWPLARAMCDQERGEVNTGESDLDRLCRSQDSWDMIAPERAMALDVEFGRWARSAARASREVTCRREDMGSLWSRSEQVGLYWDQVPNPFHAMLQIWRLGYGLEFVRDGTAVLFASSWEPQ